MSPQIVSFDSQYLNGVLALLSAAMPRESVSKEKFTRQVLLDPNFRADGALVALDNGTPVGFCLGIKRHVPLENALDDGDRGYIMLLAVQNIHQRQGIGSTLLRGVEAYLKSQGCSLVLCSPYAPGYFIPGVDVEAYPAALQFFARHGYGEVYRPLSMRASLESFEPSAKVGAKKIDLEQAGLSFSAYRPELTLPLLEFVGREFPGDWVRLVRETMGRIIEGAPPERLICAVESDRIIGFSHFQGDRFGPIGVDASQRGRGLGQILMWETLKAQYEQGSRSSWFMWTDDQTADRMYRGAGFEEVRRFALLKKSLV